MKNVSVTDTNLFNSLEDLTCNLHSPVTIELGQLMWMQKRIHDLEEIDQLNQSIHNREWDENKKLSDEVKDLKQQLKREKQISKTSNEFCWEHEKEYLEFMDRKAGINNELSEHDRTFN